MAESYTTKNITTVEEVNTLETTDKIFVNDSDSLKQISLSNLMDSSGALKKNQGAENSGKSLIVGEDGNVVLGEKPVKVDSTLSQSGYGADAKATGDRISALSIHQTVSGESLQIEDSADAPMAGLRVFGKSRQVVTTGAQLLDVRNNTSSIITTTNISFSGDGELIINGTANREDGNDDIYLVGNWGDETILYSGVNTVTIYGLTKDENIYLINNVNSLRGIGEESISRSDGITAIAIRLKKGKNYNDFRIRPMLNAGSTALPWEPYTGGKPSPSPDYPQEIEIPGSEGSVGVNVTGAQLAPINKAKSNEGITVSFNSDGSLNITGTPNRQYAHVLYEDVELEPGDYYVTGGSFEPGRMILQVVVFKPSGTKYYINTGFTIDGTETRIVCSIIYNSATIQAINLFNFKPMLNRGSTALPWEPYHTPQKLIISIPNGLPGIPVDSGGNYTDADGQQWVCDEIDYARGKYVQRVKKEVFDGSSDEVWDVQSTNDYGIVNFRHVITGCGMNAGTCSHFTEQNAGIANTQAEGFMITNINTLYFRIEQERAKDTNELRQLLSENNIVVWYVLSTPVETDLTTEQLTAYAALRTNYPTTVVTSDSDPEVGIEVEYVADTQKYIDNKFAELAQNLAATQSTLLEV